MPDVPDMREDSLAANVHLVEAWLRRQCWWSRGERTKDRTEELGDAVKAAVASDEGSR